MVSHYLAIDLGATSGRTVLASFDGNKVMMQELTRFPNRMIPLGGHLFWNLPALYDEILYALHKIAETGIELVSVGIDTWGCDFAFFGADGQLLGLPYCYRDGHTVGAQEKFFEKMAPEDIYGRTGIQFMNFNSLFQLDTLKKNGCRSLEYADKVLFIPDALIYMLTGKAICEYTVASTSQMLNPVSGDFDEDILKALGIPRDKFGTMVYPGTVIGTLNRQIRDFTGLGNVPVVAVAGHDTASAVAAVPAIDREYAYLSCGTWSLLGIETDNAIITNESYNENFTNEGGVEGTTRFLKNICGLWIFEQCRKEFRNVPESVSDLAALCECSSFNGLVNPDDSCFVNPASMSAAICEYCKATGQDIPETPADYCRCIFRSLALRYRWTVEILERICHSKVKRVHVIGGGSQNRHLMQYSANALGIPVICGPVEGTALGNVLMQMKASGAVDGLKKMKEISAASVNLVTYLPNDYDEWNKEYQRFINIIKTNKNA